MADLEACYFCGSVPEGALEEYAVVPAALSPTPDQQQSVVLCPSCRQKLTAVMEPVVESVRGTATGGSPAEGGDSPPAGADSSATAASTRNEPSAAGSDADAGDPATGADHDTDDGGVSVPPADERGDDDGVTLGRPDENGPASESADADAGSGRREAEPGSSAGAGGRSSGVESSGPESPEPASPGRESNGDDSSGGEDQGPGVDPAGGDEPRQDPRDRDEELLGRNSETYNKVLRLLRNREFPVERHDIEEVAASAYQLEQQEVSDAIDTVIQKGLLIQEGSHLRRP